MAHVKVGYSLFSKPWVQAPSSTKRRDGLGPHFNAVSCMSCHRGMGRGAPPGILHPNDPSLVLKSNSPRLKELFGDQITPKALPGIQPEFDYLNDFVHVSARIAPHLAGLGSLEKIPSSEIIRNAENGGTISFIKGEIARFGWKATQIDLTHQVAAAFSNDMGITSAQFPHENCEGSVGEKACENYLDGADEEGVEIRSDHLQMVVTLMKSIVPPVPVQNNPAGFEVFKKINCSSCHRVQYQVEGEVIRPYTDLLLHDMGDRLADSSPEGSRKQDRMWRTPPLWGLGSQALVNGHTRLLHDGRAKNVKEAILWHGGEATPSLNAFKKLSKIDEKNLLSFLKGL